MFRIFCIIVGYFIGCIQSAYIVGKFYKVDIRNYGSGNLGTTNALRVLGKRAGLITFVCDIAKSIVAFFLTQFLFGHLEGSVGIPYLAGLYGAFGAVLGHIFPFYLKFKGGKGIASTIGLILSYALCTDPKIIILIAVIALSCLCTRYVSLASLAIVITYPISLFICGIRNEVFILAIVICIITVVRHRSNIQRLINHNENKLSFKKTNKGS